MNYLIPEMFALADFGNSTFLFVLFDVGFFFGGGVFLFFVAFLFFACVKTYKKFLFVTMCNFHQLQWRRKQIEH